MTIQLTSPQAETVGDAAFRHIRDDILQGVLRPGDRLTLEKLKLHYAVSVSTLREILTRLAAESLVVAEGQRGFEVAPASETDLRELGELRLLLENHALAASLRAGDLEWEGRVVAAHHKLAAVEKQLLRGDVTRTLEWVAYDRHFHESLVSACGSRSLMAMHSSAFDRFIRFHMLAESFRGRAVADDHQALLDLSLSRDVEKAQAMLAAHVQKGIDYIIGTGKLAKAVRRA